MIFKYFKKKEKSLNWLFNVFVLTTIKSVNDLKENTLLINIELKLLLNKTQIKTLINSDVHEKFISHCLLLKKNYNVDFFMKKSIHFIDDQYMKCYEVTELSDRVKNFKDHMMKFSLCFNIINIMSYDVIIERDWLQMINSFVNWIFFS